MISYLTFVIRSTPERKTPVFDVMNKSHDNIGVVAFYPPWRKFVFESQPRIILDVVCMMEIVEFLKSETAKWKTRL